MRASFPLGISRFLRRLADLARELGAIGPLALLSVLGPTAGAVLLAVSANSWYPLLATQGPHAAVWLAAATVVLAGLSLVPTHATSLVAGMLFGAAGGSALALLGIGGAALMGFGLLRRLVGERAVEALARRPRAAVVHRAVVDRRGRDLAGLLALIRLSPVMPFAATNLLMASSRVGLGPFLAGTLAGIAPRVVAVAVAGAELQDLDLARSGDRGLALVGLAATALALWVFARIARRALAKAGL